MPRTAQRSNTLSSATAIPKAMPRMGEDGFPVKVWNVDGEDVEFSLRPFTQEEKDARRYWCPKGPGAKMWWRSQEKNDYGLQPIIQREEFIDGSFKPRNAWEEYMTVDWLTRNCDGGSAAATKWVGYDHPDNKPGQPPKLWICAECGNSLGTWSVFDQHQRSKRHSGITRND